MTKDRIAANHEFDSSGSNACSRVRRFPCMNCEREVVVSVGLSGRTTWACPCGCNGDFADGQDLATNAAKMLADAERILVDLESQLAHEAAPRWEVINPLLNATQKVQFVIEALRES